MQRIAFKPTTPVQGRYLHCPGSSSAPSASRRLARPRMQLTGPISRARAVTRRRPITTSKCGARMAVLTFCNVQTRTFLYMRTCSLPTSAPFCCSKYAYSLCRNGQLRSVVREIDLKRDDLQYGVIYDCVAVAHPSHDVGATSSDRGSSPSATASHRAVKTYFCYTNVTEHALQNPHCHIVEICKTACEIRFPGYSRR
ncbi:hypothetical protein PENSPDRAFT_54011 [Peniophora sp. CONT]|nr:hypothetical protein PENSPDRAFT_54011 [Peniophora sp. CONT]